MALQCKSNYQSTFKYKAISFQAGDVVDDAELEAFVLSDSPESFEAVADTTKADGDLTGKALEEPPVDKAVRSSAKKKVTGDVE